MDTPPMRVLVEHENPRILQAHTAALEAAGFQVTGCAGPAAQEGGECPLVTSGYCHEAFTADVIVDALPLGDMRVYAAQRDHLANAPVLLGVSEAERVRYPLLEDVATCMPRNASATELVEAVRAAAGGEPPSAA